MKIKMETRQSSPRLKALLGITAAGAMLGTTANGALIGHWAFDEGTGAIAGDSSPGSANPGVITDGAWGSDGTRASFLTFNGTSSIVDPSISLPVMTTTNDFTWAFWANSGAAISGTQQNSVILGNRKDGTNTEFVPRQFIKFTPLQFEWHQEGGGADNQDYDDLVVGEWHHIALVKTGTSVQLYRDGVATGAPGTLGTSLANAVAMPLFIGGDLGNPSVNEYFTGNIDDVRIYDNALTGGQVAALIPEPSSFLLGALGVSLAFRRRR